MLAREIVTRACVAPSLNRPPLKRIPLLGSGLRLSANEEDDAMASQKALQPIAVWKAPAPRRRRRAEDGDVGAETRVGILPPQSRDVPVAGAGERRAVLPRPEGQAQLRAGSLGKQSRARRRLSPLQHQTVHIAPVGGQAQAGTLVTGEHQGRPLASHRWDVRHSGDLSPEPSLRTSCCSCDGLDPLTSLPAQGV